MDGPAVLWVCALKDEYEQVLQVQDGLRDPGWRTFTQSDGIVVAEALFRCVGNQHIRVEVSWVGHMGRERAQAMTSQLLRTRQPSCIVMSGICAGRRGKVSLGDVILADRLWTYDAGKLTVDGRHSTFQGDMLQYRAPIAWLQQMQLLQVLPATPWLALRPPITLEYQEEWVLLELFHGRNPRDQTDFTSHCPHWSEVLPRMRARGWLGIGLNLTELASSEACTTNRRSTGEQNVPGRRTMAPCWTRSSARTDSAYWSTA